MKTMLITGGARGIGAQLVRHFAAAGWRVMFCYRQSRQAAEKLAAETDAIAVCCDVRQEEQVKALIAEALRVFRHRVAHEDERVAVVDDLLAGARGERGRGQEDGERAVRFHLAVPPLRQSTVNITRGRLAGGGGGSPPYS